MADKRTRIDDLMARVIRTGERNSASPRNSAGFDPVYELLTNELLRRDPNRVAAKKIQRFLGEREATREAKLGETLGLGDALTFMPAGMAAKSLLAREFLPAGVNALAFTSQFDDSKLGSAVGDLTAAYPLFGMRNIGGALKSAKRAAELGKQPPIFNMAEGRIAPNRMKLIEKGLREHIAMSGTKDVPGQLRKLDEWIERNPFWGKYPLHKRELFDTFPQDISGSLDQTLKDLGYGGITQAPRDLSLLVDKRVNRPGIPDRSSTLTRTWEEKKPFEQKALAGEPSGILKGWMERNPGKTPPIFTRPGEQTPAGWRNLLDTDAKTLGAGQSIDPKTKAFLEQLAIGSGIGTAANLATGGIPSAEGDNRAGLVVNSRNLGRLAKLQEAARTRLDKIRPAFPEMNYLESVFAAKYPKIYEKAAGASPKGAFNPSLNGISSGSFSPFTSRVSVGMPDSAAGWNKPSTIPNIFNTMGHEALHGVDFQRLGNVNHPWTGRRLDVGDFIAPEAAARPREMRDLIDNLKRFYPDADKMVKNLKPKYTLPGPDDENFFTRLPKDIRYLTNPIELRARKAGKTSSKTLSNLMDRLTSFEE